MKFHVNCPPPGTPINWGNGLSKGLVGSWLLNEGCGKKAFDSSGKCLIPGIITSASVYKNMQRGQCCTFPTVGSDAIDLGTQPALNLTSGPMTLSAWVCPISTSGSVTYYIGASANSAFSLNDWGMNWNVSQKFQFFHAAGSAIITTTNAFSTVGVWYHVVGVRSGGTGSWGLAIYVNGKLENSTTTSTNPSAQQNAKIARPGLVSGNFSWNGYIQNFQIWNRALSATEIWNLYTNPYQTYIKPR